MPANRTESGKFVKGKSGNPSGRPKMPEDIKMALKDLVPTAVNKLSNIINCTDDERILLEAIKTLLDRVYGKPKQEIDASIDGSVDLNVEFGEEIRMQLAEKLMQMKGYKG